MASVTSRTTRAAHLGPARRREPVLDAALDVFADAGYAAATMAAIAERAEITKSVLYDCFPGGKKEIWTALLERVGADFAEHLGRVEQASEAPQLEDALAAGLRAFMSYADINPTAFRLVFGETGSADPEIREGVERVREHNVALLRDRVVARSHLPYDPFRGGEWFARIVVAVAEELAHWTVREPQIPRDLYIDLAARWLSKGLVVGTAEVVQEYHRLATE